MPGPASSREGAAPARPGDSRDGAAPPVDGNSLGAAAPAAPSPEPLATLQAWRARGDDRLDPLRFNFMEALARRTATHAGEARRLLDQRLARLLAAYGDALGAAPAAQQDGARPAVRRDGRLPAAQRSADLPAPRPAEAQQRAANGPLAELTAHLARHGASHADRPAPGPAAGPASAPPELKSLDHFRGIWNRLSAERRLTQSLAKVPGNAGPLNSHHLVQRSLNLMRELSPAYLHRFMAYVDALEWLDQASAPGAAAPAPAAQRADSPKPRKGGRARPG